jgi:hypothetical protein
MALVLWHRIPMKKRRKAKKRPRKPDVNQLASRLVRSTIRISENPSKSPAN